MRCVGTWIALGGLVAAWLGGSCPAWAQPALERLELQLQGAAPLPPSPGPPAPAPVPPPPTPEVVPAPTPGKAYLAILADDRNDRGRGVRVLKIFANGAGDKAGLKEQDLITSMADVRVRQMSELSDLLDLYSPGDQVWIEIQRDGKPQRVRMTLDRRPTDEQAPAPPANPPAPALPPGVPEVVPSAPQMQPPPPDATVSDHQRITMLEQRIAELEKRISELERQLRGK